MESPFLISAFLGARVIGWNSDEIVVKELEEWVHK